MDVSGNISAVLGQKTREIFSVTPDTCVDDAVKMMDEKNVGALLVMKGEKLVGMLSERDYTRKVMLRGKKSSETKVSDIMSTNLTVTNPSEGVEECLRAMTDKRFRQFPAVERRIARQRVKLIDPDCPFQLGIDQGDVRRSPDRQCSCSKLQQLSR